MNDSKRKQLTGRSPIGVRKTMFPNHREVLLARLLLQVADRIAGEDEDQEFIQLYNEVKAIAEPVVREASNG